MKVNVSKIGRIVATVALCTATMGVVVGCGGGDAGKAAVDKNCNTDCHDLTNIENAVANGTYTSASDWDGLVDRMQGLSGGAISDEDKAAISAYLQTL